MLNQATSDTDTRQVQMLTTSAAVTRLTGRPINAVAGVVVVVDADVVVADAGLLLVVAEEIVVATIVVGYLC